MSSVNVIVKLGMAWFIRGHEIRIFTSTPPTPPPPPPETLYYFGDNNREGWDSLFSLYHLPPYHLPGMSPVLSFGMAGTNQWRFLVIDGGALVFEEKGIHLINF